MDMDMDSSLIEYCTSEEQEKHLFHVLAVDDSNLDRKLLERLLTFSSYQVTCVDSGDKALEYLGLLNFHPDKNNHVYDDDDNRSSPSSSSSPITISSHSSLSKSHQASKINLIMTDYSMPGISGYDLLKRIKDSSWKDVPVVVMSSENVPARINMCMEGGAEEFILKPVKLSDLTKLHSHLITSTNSYINPSCQPKCDNIENANNTNAEAAETDHNDCTNASKRKSTLSELSDRRPRVQELPVS